MTSAAKKVFVVLSLGAVGLTIFILVVREFYSSRFLSLKKQRIGYRYEVEATIAFEKGNNSSHANDLKILMNRLSYIGYNCSAEMKTNDSYTLKIKNATDTQSVKELLITNGNFACHELFTTTDIGSSLEMADKTLAARSQKNIAEHEAAKKNPDSVSINTLLRKSESSPDPLEHPLFSILSPNMLKGEAAVTPAYIGRIKEKDTARLNALLHRTEIKKYFPEDVMFAYGKDRNALSETTYFFLYALRRPANPAIDESFITTAEDRIESDKDGVQVIIKFGKFGAGLWEKMTHENVHKRIAITMDNAVISAPLVEEPVSGGIISIYMFDVQEARTLSALLQFGALSSKPILRSFQATK